MEILEEDAGLYSVKRTFARLRRSWQENVGQLSETWRKVSAQFYTLEWLTSCACISMIYMHPGCMHACLLAWMLACMRPPLSFSLSLSLALSPSFSLARSRSRSLVLPDV